LNKELNFRQHFLDRGRFMIVIGKCLLGFLGYSFIPTHFKKIGRPGMKEELGKIAELFRLETLKQRLEKNKAYYENIVYSIFFYSPGFSTFARS